MIFDPENIPTRDIYHLLTATVVPRPIAWVTSHSPDGVVNAAPYSFFNAITADPPLIILGVGSRKGQQKDTASNILSAREFVINIVNEEMAQAMNITSADFPHSVSEIEQAGLSLLPSEKVKVPRISRSPVHMECTLEQHVQVGNGSADLIIGKVVLFHVADAVMKDGRIDHEELRAIGRLSGSSYCKTTAILEMKKPVL